MKYIFLSIIVTILIGCGSSTSSEEVPASPQSQDSTKIPPAVPKI